MWISWNSRCHVNMTDTVGHQNLLHKNWIPFVNLDFAHMSNNFEPSGKIIRLIARGFCKNRLCFLLHIIPFHPGLIQSIWSHFLCRRSKYNLLSCWKWGLWSIVKAIRYLTILPNCFINRPGDKESFDCCPNHSEIPSMQHASPS